jgi:hypothetical protein
MAPDEEEPDEDEALGVLVAPELVVPVLVVSRSSVQGGLRGV